MHLCLIHKPTTSDVLKQISTSLLYGFCIVDVDYFGTGEKGEMKSCDLLGYILDGLHKCMMYDSDKLFHKEVFTMLLKPLVDQVNKKYDDLIILLPQLTEIVYKHTVESIN